MNMFLKSLGLFSLFLYYCNPASAAQPWQQIPANTPFVDGNGVQRTPSCSGGPVVTPNGAVPGKTDFSFFFRSGDPTRLVIALDGGGACWDANTCVGSPLKGTSVYDAEILDTPATVAQIGGLGDDANPANPVSGYTQVYVPYCTGDLHWGSRDTDYTYTAPDGSTTTWTIHHRGFDNLLAMLRWLGQYYLTSELAPPDKVVVVGGSAGGYGTLMLLPVLKRLLPRSTQTYVAVDSANGVISGDLYRRALGGYAVSGGVWGIENNLPRFMATDFAVGPDALAVSTMTGLAQHYPNTRLGQYTRAWDATQIFFTNVMKQVYNPARWTDPNYLIPTALEWTLSARAYMLLDATAPNYRFYMGAGTAHTAMADSSFYSEHSGSGVYLSDWLNDMINPPASGNGHWRNVSCVPNCLTP